MLVIFSIAHFAKKGKGKDEYDFFDTKGDPAKAKPLWGEGGATERKKPLAVLRQRVDGCGVCDDVVAGGGFLHGTPAGRSVPDPRNVIARR